MNKQDTAQTANTNDGILNKVTKIGQLVVEPQVLPFSIVGLFGAYLLGKYGATKGGYAVTAGFALSGFLIAGGIAAGISLQFKQRREAWDGIFIIPVIGGGVGLLGITYLGNYFFGKKK